MISSLIKGSWPQLSACKRGPGSVMTGRVRLSFAIRVSAVALSLANVIRRGYGLDIEYQIQLIID